MSRIPHVIKRRHSFFLRVRNPSDVAAIVGSAYHVRTLRTRDPKQARIEAAHALVEAHTVWNEIRRASMAKILGKEIHEIEGDDMLRIRNEDIEALSPEDRYVLIQRMQFLCDRQKLDAERVQARRMKLDLELALLKNESAELERSLQQKKLIEMQGSAAVMQAEQALQLAQVRQVMQETLARLGSGSAGSELPPESSLNWDDKSFLERFFADRPVSDKTRDSYGTVFDEFAKMLGDSRPLRDIRKTDVKRYAEYLRDRPSSRGGALDRKTIKKNLSHLKAYFGWHVGAGQLLSNPAEDVHPPREARTLNPDQLARRAFREDELRVLFNSPLFTGCKSKSRLSKPGSNVYRNERFWFWITMLLTGARLEEIALAPSKLTSVGDVLCLDLRHATKTQNAPRLIPIIPELQEVGFIEWCAEQQSRGRRLVEGPDAPEDWSKWLNRYLDAIGLDDEALVFYSLRHNFRQQLRAADLHPEIVDKIFGHEGQSVGAGYGRELSPSEAKLVVERVKSPVSLAHL